MNNIRRYLGILWMITGPVCFILMLRAAFKYIGSGVKGDINNPVPWIIILVIFLPIATGLVIFGWYCYKGEYSRKEV